MTTAAGPARVRRNLPVGKNPALSVSAYERVASMLLALLVLIGAIVFCLFVAWLSSRIFFPPLKPVEVMIQQVGGGMESGVVGESMQLDSPTPQDIAQESDMVEPELRETLAAVLDSVALHQADLDDPSLTDQSEFKGGGRQTGTGDRAGYGSGDGPPGIPPHLRWEIRFQEGNTLEQYAKQLDFFGIELGILGATNQVIYAFHLANPKPDTRTGPRDQESRLYMSWRQGKLKEADRELMTKAGVAAAGKIILQFYSTDLEQQLLRLERDFKGKDASGIRKTRFAIRAAGNGFEFYVIDQSYL